MSSDCVTKMFLILFSTLSFRRGSLVSKKGREEVVMFLQMYRPGILQLFHVRTIKDLSGCFPGLVSLLPGYHRRDNRECAGIVSPLSWQLPGRRFCFTDWHRNEIVRSPREEQYIYICMYIYIKSAHSVLLPANREPSLTLKSWIHCMDRK